MKYFCISGILVYNNQTKDHKNPKYILAMQRKTDQCALHKLISLLRSRHSTFSAISLTHKTRATKPCVCDIKVSKTPQGVTSRQLDRPAVPAGLNPCYPLNRPLAHRSIEAPGSRVLIHTKESRYTQDHKTLPISIYG